MLGGFGILGQKGFGAHDHARSAEAALDGSRLTEGFCEYVLFPLGESLYGKDIGILDFRDQKGTGSHGLSVDYDRTGPACALRAPVLDRCQVQVIPKETQEFFVSGGSNSLSVDPERECHTRISLLNDLPRAEGPSLLDFLLNARTTMTRR